MNDNLQKYLDGDLPLDALSAAERVAAEEWRELMSGDADMRRVSAPRWIETRVMATLPERPYRSRAEAMLSWLTVPRLIQVRPVSLGLVGAAAALLLFVARPQAPAPTTVVNPPSSVQQVSATVPSIVYVQFVFADRKAKSVNVAGDFNAWDTSSTQLSDVDGDGVWTGLVALRPGQHKYMFVIDGKQWVTDPEAERYIDDDFGMRNAVITITQPTGRSI